MAKKKFREITVEGTKYGWTVNPVKYDGIEITDKRNLSIWLDKKVIHNETVRDTKTITPKFVSEVILKIK